MLAASVSAGGSFQRSLRQVLAKAGAAASERTAKTVTRGEENCPLGV